LFGRVQLVLFLQHASLFLLLHMVSSNIWPQAPILGLSQQVSQKFLFSLSVPVVVVHQWRQQDMVVVGVV
jgi:hypothetical protein